MTAPTGPCAVGLAHSEDWHQTPPLPPPRLRHHPPNMEGRGRKDCGEDAARAGRVKAKAGGRWSRGRRGPCSHHSARSLTREGGDRAGTGREDGKQAREEYMHQQVKTDFKPIMKIN